MNYTDTQRLDFLEKWETSSHQHSWFTLLTQHIRKQDCPTLRDFCNYGLNFEEMLDLNGLDVISWHYLPTHLQEIVINIWENEGRCLTDDEKISLQEESGKHWEELHETEVDNSDK